MSGYIFPVYGGGVSTSGYGSRRDPFTGATRQHGGIDISGKAGTPILATSNQTVTKAYKSSSYGNVVFTRDAQGYEHRYAHLQGYNVQAGQTLSAGQQLGALGSTGRSTGNHLHYEVRDKSGKILNPNNILSGAQKLLKSDAARAVLAGVTGGASEAVLSVVPDSLNPFGRQSWLDQLKAWIKDSGFFQRLALALFAFILLFAAFYLFKGNALLSVTNRAKEALT